MKQDQRCRKAHASLCKSRSSQPASGAATVRPPGMPDASPLAALKLLNLLDGDAARGNFFPAVAERLCAATEPSTIAAAALQEAFGLDFVAEPQAQALLFATKLLLSRVTSLAYEAEGAAAALHADLVAAGLAAAAATWVQQAAEAAALPVAAALRTAQAHAAANQTQDYLHDFDWSLHYVLGSSTIAKVQAPLVSLHLQIAKAGTTQGEMVTESLELTPSDLDATIDVLASANEALRALPA